MIATCHIRCHPHAGAAPARRKVHHSAGLFALAQAIRSLSTAGGGMGIPLVVGGLAMLRYLVWADYPDSPQ